MFHISVRALRALALFAAPLALVPSTLEAHTAAQPSTSLPPLDVTAAPKAQAKRPAAPKQATPAAAAPAPASTPTAQSGAPGTQVAPGIPASAAAQPVSTITRDRVENTRAFSVADLLQEVPGISIKQGNGPRDMGVSIRGSNARNGFAVRNIQVFEDGFPVTQPDGLSRTDLTDPHAYGGVDVWRGPSSALFGNYATGGAINFRTRPGGDINGFEYGVDVGSFGYVNNYMALGEKTRFFEYALFASDVRSTGHLDYNGFNTQTVNLTASYTPSSSDKFTFKFIHNALDTQLSTRVNLVNFYRNPYQQGCDVPVVSGCQTTLLLRNGANGATDPRTAAQAGFNRHDYRTIAGLRWEHKVDENTEWQVQAVLDDRDINQPTGSTSAIGDYFSKSFSGSLSQRYSFFGLPAKHIVGAFYNDLPNDAYTYNVTSAGNATLGKLRQTVTGGTTNTGARVREEISPSSNWLFVAGASIEQTKLSGVSTGYNYTGNAQLSSLSIVSTDRTLMSHAQEIGLVYKPDREWQFRGRVATGYGAPQLTNLFINAQGLPGDNTQLQSQSNVGYDLGFDWTPNRVFTLSLTGFYEFFQNEIVSQAAGGANTQNYSFNAPRSEHRGVEAAAKINLPSGWSGMAAYLYNDQLYTEYTERLSSGGIFGDFRRVGNKIPGNSPNELLTRLGYDQPVGPLKGLGAYVEYQWKDAFFLDNGNYLKAPGYDLVNLNVHYKPELAAGPIKGLTMFFEVRNLFDKTYIASANNVSNGISAATGAENGASTLAGSTGSIYAGMPQTFYGGMKVKF
jgi:iron complex outermembrane receptor protein